MLCRRGRFRRVLRQVPVYLAGLLLGLVSSTIIANVRIASKANCKHIENEVKEPALLLVGVMSAAKYVDTRAYEIWNTWARHINGKVLFFVADGTESAFGDLPLIKLKGVNDVYPPQKKSFAMLKWMADNHLHDYDWFMRADDDLYVRADRLESLLRSLDSGKPQLLGQAGLGNTAEYGQLALGQQDNYCMGGPGVVLSRVTLSMVAPHLQSCLTELLSTHEDVELGRCIRKHVGVTCTWNYEMHTLFYNNKSALNVGHGSSATELRRAITLHPIKQQSVMRRVHLRNRSLRLSTLRTTRLTLQNELPGRKSPLLLRHVANATRDLIHWDFISANNIIYCASHVNCPRHTVDLSIRTAINDIITQLFDEFNSNARQRGRVLQFQNIQYGYMRVEPRFGVDYVLDMILWFKKFRPPHRATLSVRRHAYVQQTFGSLLAISDQTFRETLRRRLAKSIRLTGEPDLKLTQRENWQQQQEQEIRFATEKSRVHLILPLAGRADTFKRFASNLRSLCEDRETIALVVVLYDSTPNIDGTILAQIRELQTEIDVNVIPMGKAPFSRGTALAQGAAILDSGALMFFVDVDMLFTCDTIHRAIMNTVRGAQVYFPIVFSEYSPETWSDSDRLLSDAFHYGRKRGYFRHFGFGLVSIFKSDLDIVGGFNTSIQGWGIEDVDLFEKCVKSPLRVMRAPDPGLVHIYHTILCNESMPEAQYAMCVGSRAASLASLDSLVDQISSFS